MKDFKYNKHGHSPESEKNVQSTIYMQKFRGKRNINIPRIIYSIVLIYICGVILFYFGNKLFFVTGKGVVISSKYAIRVEEDIAIQDFWVNIGDSIHTGDTLFAYQSASQVKDLKESNRIIELRINSYIKEKNELTKNINLKEIKKRHYQRLYNNKKELLKTLKKEVYLDVSKRERLEKTKLEAEDIKEDIHFIKDEINYLRGYLYQHKVNYKYTTKRLNKTLTDLSETKHYISPVDGLVSNTANTGYILSKKDDIIEINKDEGVVIIANISQKSMSQIDTGENLTIVFSDGQRSSGIVKEILEPENVDQMIDTRQLDEMTKIQLKIIPKKGEEENWISRIGYTVKIKKTKIFF